MRDKDSRISISLTDLWSIWSKGRATGSMMAEAGMELNGLCTGRASEYAEEEMHKDISDVIGTREYIEAFKGSGFNAPRFLKDV